MGSAEEVSALAPPEDGGPTPESALIRAVTTEQLDRAIRTLPPDFREVFLLREVEGLAYKEIAEVADIPIGTVMSRLARARQMLQGRLARDGARGEHEQ
ncbi:MAG TPA: sigma-70 family RNA polymerase sigma factor, partial [Polyangia bacterium]|nr:sigma-70 family RNA polymerase sigma factor [Polyangia bacterium]